MGYGLKSFAHEQQSRPEQAERSSGMVYGQSDFVVLARAALALVPAYVSTKVLKVSPEGEGFRPIVETKKKQPPAQMPGAVFIFYFFGA